MTTESVLKLGVDTTDVRRGTTDLEALAAAGKRAESAAVGLDTGLDKVGTAAAGAGRAVSTIATATDGASQAIQRTKTAASDLAGALTNVDSRMTAAAAGVSGVGKAASEASQQLGKVGTASTAAASNIDAIDAASKRASSAAKALAIDLDKVGTSRGASGFESLAGLEKAGTSLGAASAQVRQFDASIKSIDTSALDKAGTSLGLIGTQANGLRKAAADIPAGLKPAQESVKQLGVSAGQTAAAMRQLPAQFTDIVTSLQAGQSPFTVLLQQGGQIKDSFGGVGNALRALGSLITPVRLAIGGAAAALGVLALAYKQGSGEADEYRKAIVLTGNASGTTTAALAATAAEVAKLGGTQGKAAEVLAQLAGSGKVAATEFKALTAAAIALERAGGPAATETAKAFAELGKAPTQAALKLTETTGFLTAEVFKQISALERQGKTAEAAALAQREYAKTVQDQAKQLEGGLGTLEKAWRSVADAAKGAWDAALGVGRPETSLDRLQTAADALAKAARLNRLPAFGSSPIANQSNAQQDYQAAVSASGYEGLDAYYAKLKKEAQSAGIEFEKLAQAAKLPKAALDDDIAKVRELGKAAGLEAKQIDDLVKRTTSLSAAAALSFGNRQAAIAADATISAAKVGAAIQDLQAKAAIGLISEYELIRKIAEVNLQASKAEESRIRQSIENARSLPAERQQQALIQLNAQLAAQQVKTAAEAKAAEDKVTAAIYQRRLSVEALTRAEMERQSQELADYERNIGDQYRAAANANADYAQSIKDSAYALEQEAIAAQLPAQEREIRLKQIAIEIKLREDLRKIQSASYGPGQREALIKQVTDNALAASQQAADKVAQDIQTKAADAAVESFRDAARDIGSTLADAILEGGQAGAKSISDLFKRLVLRPLVQAGTDGLVNAVVGAAGGQTYAQSAQSVQSLQALQSLYSYGQSAYGYLAGGSAAAAAGGTVTYGTSATIGGTLAQSSATKAALYGAEGYGSAAAGSSAGGSSAAASASSWGPYVAAIVASYLISSRAYREGFTTQNTDNSFFDSGLAGSMGLGGSYYVARGLDSLGIGSTRNNQIFSGAAGLNYLFGRAAPRIEEYGVQGTIGAGGFDGTAYTDILQKGGLFRSDRRTTQTTEVSAQIDNLIDSASEAVRKKARDFGAALGLPAEALAGVVANVRIKFTSSAVDELSKKYGEDLAKPFEQLSDEGKRIAQSSEFSDAVRADQEKNLAEIEAALSSYGDALVSGFAASLQPVAQYGETTVQTIERVGTSLLGVNEVLDSLGVAALDSSVAGAQAALAIQDLFGGLNGLQQAASGYLQNYYSDAERANLITASLSKTLGEVGVTLPSTRDGFRDLVEAQDLSTASGRETFAALMSVADAFAEITPLGRSAADILSERQDLERQLLQAQGDSNALRALEREALDASNRALYDQITALEDQRAAAEKAAEGWRALDAAIAANIGRFISPQQGEGLRRGQIATELQQSGAFGGASQADILSTITGATREQIFEFARSFVLLGDASLEAKTAVVNAAGALADLIDAADQRQLDEITARYGDVLGALNEPVETLADAYTRTRGEADALRDSLDAMLGSAAKTIQETLSDLLNSQRELQGFRAQLADSIGAAQLSGMTPEARIAALRGQERDLFAQLDTAADPTAVAQRLQKVVLDRIAQEAAIRQSASDLAMRELQSQADLAKKARDAQIDTLRKQIDGAERLARLAEDIAQFTGSLRFSDISPLSFDQQLGAARGLFDSTLAGAQAGDQTAQGNLTQNARAYLDEARSYYASSGAYADIFAQVTSSLDSLGLSGANVDPQIAALENQLAQLQELNAAQENIQRAVIDTSAEQVAALSAIDSALARRDEAQAALIERQIALAEQEVARREADAAAQRTQLTAIAAQVIELLARLNRTTETGVTEASLTGAAP